MLAAGSQDSSVRTDFGKGADRGFRRGHLCVGERMLFGCYSASVDLQKESANLVFSGELPVEDLISHRLPLDQITFGFRSGIASGT